MESSSCIDRCDIGCLSISATNDGDTSLSSTDLPMSDLLQIDCRFINPSTTTISNLVSSINSNDASGYLSTAHVLLEECMSKSFMYIRSIKIHPPLCCSNFSHRDPEYGYGDPVPQRDTYIKNDGKYGLLQYMCDYFKYCMLGNDETNEEREEEEQTLNSERRKLYEHRDLLLLEHQSKSIKSRNKLPSSMSIYELAVDSEIEPEMECADKYAALVSGVRNALEWRLVNKSDFTGIYTEKKPTGNTEIVVNNCDVSMEIPWKLIDKLKFTNVSKKKRSLRNADIEARDNCIFYCMKYYLSLRNKLELVARTKFKDKDELIKECFNKIPMPEKADLKAYSVYSAPPFSRSCPYYARPYYANSGSKISADMDIVEERMNNYCSRSKIALIPI